MISLWVALPEPVPKKLPVVFLGPHRVELDVNQEWEVLRWRTITRAFSK